MHDRRARSTTKSGFPMACSGPYSRRPFQAGQALPLPRPCRVPPHSSLLFPSPCPTPLSLTTHVGHGGTYLSTSSHRRLIDLEELLLYGLMRINGKWRDLHGRQEPTRYGKEGAIQGLFRCLVSDLSRSWSDRSRPNFCRIIVFLERGALFRAPFHGSQYRVRCADALAVDRNRNLDLFRSGRVPVPQFVPGAGAPGVAAFLRERLFRGILYTAAFGYLKVNSPQRTQRSQRPNE